MDKLEFLDSLPVETDCVSCGAILTNLQWQIAPYGDQWLGVCLMRCDCSWFKCAAAGSDDASHAQAQAMRSKLLRSIGK